MARSLSHRGTPRRLDGLSEVSRIFQLHTYSSRGCAFLWGGLCGVFGPWREHAGGGAFGRGPVRATPATPVRGQVRREDVARRGQKPLGRSPGASFLSPLSLAIKERGRGGGGGAQPPRLKRGLRFGFCSDAACRVAIRRCVVLTIQDTVSRLELPACACPWCYPKRSFRLTAIVPHFFRYLCAKLAYGLGL